MSEISPYNAGVRSELGRAITNVAVPHNEPPVVVRRRRVVVGGAQNMEGETLGALGAYAG